MAAGSTYMSMESGQGNVYIDSFPEPGRKHRVSIDGGSRPGWTADGTEIRFIADGKFLKASVETEPRDCARGFPRSSSRSTPMCGAGAGLRMGGRS